MKLKNYTPHAVHLIATVPSGEITIEIPSDGVARCAQTSVDVGSFDFGDGVSLPIRETAFGEVSGLPAEEEGVLIIVSSLVAQALKGVRGDLLIPTDMVRDSEGKILGCKALGRI